MTTAKKPLNLESVQRELGGSKESFMSFWLGELNIRKFGEEEIGSLEKKFIP